MSASLYIVATPIGNLADMSPRAIETLRMVDLIAAEDANHSRPLLQHFAINTPLSAYHEHNERAQTPRLIEKLQAGRSIAIISDAGTPLINDPGYRLVKSAHEHGVPVTPIPGPSAVITALSASGLPVDSFVYEGYLAARTAARRQRLEKLRFETRTLVFYETPHRIISTIRDMLLIFGQARRVAIARELTKYYEQIVMDSMINILTALEDETIKARGEFVVIVTGATAIKSDDIEALRVHGILAEKLSSADAALLTARITKRSKNDIYKMMLAKKNKGDDRGP